MSYLTAQQISEKYTALSHQFNALAWSATEAGLIVTVSASEHKNKRSGGSAPILTVSVDWPAQAEEVAS